MFCETGRVLSHEGPPGTPESWKTPIHPTQVVKPSHPFKRVKDVTLVEESFKKSVLELSSCFDRVKKEKSLNFSKQNKTKRKTRRLRITKFMISHVIWSDSKIVSKDHQI